MSNVNGKSDVTPTESKTTCTVGNFSHGSRETPATSVFLTKADRSEKARGHKSDMHVTGESDDLVVPEKRANNAGTPVAESVEERRSAKGNGIRARTCRTQCRDSVSYSIEYRTARRSLGD